MERDDDSVSLVRGGDRGWNATKAAVVVLFLLQLLFYIALFLEGNYGRGTVVFTVVFSIGSMLTPFLLCYSVLYYFRQHGTREDITVYVPIGVLLTATWVFIMGVLKLFLDTIEKDVFGDIVPAFNTRDHALTWLLAVLYVATLTQSLRIFFNHIQLITAKRKGLSLGEVADFLKQDNSILYLFLLQLSLNVVFFVIGLDVLEEENACAFCVGCVVHGHERRSVCNDDISEEACTSGGHVWCSSRFGPSYTGSFIATFALASFALGFVFVLVVMQSFGDKHSLLAIDDTPKWALMPVIVLVVDTWVCGSGVVRVFMHVLNVQAMRDVYPLFSQYRVGLFFALCVLYMLHIPVCFYLVLAHMSRHQRSVRRQSLSRVAE